MRAVFHALGKPRYQQKAGRTHSVFSTYCPKLNMFFHQPTAKEEEAGRHEWIDEIEAETVVLPDREEFGRMMVNSDID